MLLVADIPHEGGTTMLTVPTEEQLQEIAGLRHSTLPYGYITENLRINDNWARMIAESPPPTNTNPQIE